MLKSAKAAVPDPVKYGSLSAAEVSPAKAASSASYACTFVPIANPRAVRAAEAVAPPVPPLAMGRVPVTEEVREIGAPPPAVPSWLCPVVSLAKASIALNSLLE